MSFLRFMTDVLVPDHTFRKQAKRRAWFDKQKRLKKQQDELDWKYNHY